MIGKTVGGWFCSWRDSLAGMLVRAGATPNMLTIAGMAWMIVAAVFLALGAGAPIGASLGPGDLRRYDPNLYCILAGVALVLCSAGDMLDGAVARIGNSATTFGAFLDSTLDRVGDFAIYLGIAWYFALRGNVTFTVLPFLAFFAGVMISYTRARAEDLIKHCTVGYWQRGERNAAMLIAALAGNIPALVLQQATSPLLTVWARIRHTWAVTNGQSPIIDPRQSPRALDRLKWWRYPRMTVQYDIVTLLNIAWLIFARIPATFDPLGQALGR